MTRWASIAAALRHLADQQRALAARDFAARWRVRTTQYGNVLEAIYRPSAPERRVA